MTAAKSRTQRRIQLAQAFFPQLKDVQFTHAWEGSLGVPRQFAPHIVVDESRCIATAGGYLGEGVGASYLFGRTLAESITQTASARLTMPWVRRGDLIVELPCWEPEPLPWLGFNGVMRAVDLEDYWQRRSLPGKTAMERLCDGLEGLVGLH